MDPVTVLAGRRVEVRLSVGFLLVV